MTGTAKMIVAAMLSALTVAGIVAERDLFPPATAQEAKATPVRPRVGDTPAANQLKMIEDPGRFGMGPGPRGSRYAVYKGHLVRLDANTGKIMSVLRPLPGAAR